MPIALLNNVVNIKGFAEYFYIDGSSWRLKTMREIPLTPTQIKQLRGVDHGPLIAVLDGKTLLLRPIMYHCAESIFVCQLHEDKKRLINAIQW